MECGYRGANGLFDLSDRYARLNAKKDPLIGINAVVPWNAFRPLRELVWRKPMNMVLMFKTLVPSALYNLSDDQIEYQVRDRLSFMRFLGLRDRVPDAKAGMVDELFAQFDGVSGAAGLYRAWRTDP
jgi:IS5 family transposase